MWVYVGVWVYVCVGACLGEYVGGGYYFFDPNEKCNRRAIQSPREDEQKGNICLEVIEDVIGVICDL